MLIVAKAKEKELQEAYQRVIYNPKYKYAFGLGNCRNMMITIDDSDWGLIQLVSYDVANNKILGYIEFMIDRPEYIVRDVFMLNFSSPSDSTFLKDLSDAFKKVFLELNIPKVCFSVLIGNPAEKQYDNFIKRYGGSIIGTYKKHVLVNNEFKDKKVYEIMREDFMKTIKRRK